MQRFFLQYPFFMALWFYHDSQQAPVLVEGLGVYTSRTRVYSKNALLQNVLEQNTAVKKNIAVTSTVYEHITEAASVATIIRKKIATNNRIANQLLEDLKLKHTKLRDDQSNALQRLQQVLYRYTNVPSFLSNPNVLTLLDLVLRPSDSYRWFDVDRRSVQEKTTQNLLRWICTANPLSYRDGNKMAATVTSIRLERSPTLERAKLTDDVPNILLVSRTCRFRYGYVAVAIEWDNTSDLSLSTSSPVVKANVSDAVSVPRGNRPGWGKTWPSCTSYIDPIGVRVIRSSFSDIKDLKPSLLEYNNCAHFVTPDLGFLTLSITPTNPIDLTARLGRVNNGHTTQWAPAVVPNTLLAQLKTAGTPLFLVVALDAKDSIRVYLNQNLIQEVQLRSPWPNEGYAGIHAKTSHVSFKEFAAAPLFLEAPQQMRYIFGTNIEGLKAPVIPQPLDTAAYTAFAAQRKKRSSSVPQSVKEVKTVAASSRRSGGPYCYDFEKLLFNLNDWESSDQSGWMTTKDSLTGSQRLTLSGPVNVTRGAMVLLKNFSCQAASVNVRIRLYDASQAGIVFHAVNKVQNRYLATIDTGFNIVELTHTVQENPTTLAVAVVPEAQPGALHGLEVNDRNGTITNTQVLFNGQKVISHVTNATEALTAQLHNPRDDKENTLRLNTPPGSQGGYGLWIGRGNAEFFNFKLRDTIGFT